MKSLVIIALFATLALTACVVSPGPPGYGGIEVAPLPPVVELGAEPYYYQNGYYYYYHNDGWSYSNARNGPWQTLPRSHWPREIRHREHHDERGWGEDRGREERHEREHEHDRD